MTTPSPSLKELRIAAGQRYAAALAELRSAYGELAAYDLWFGAFGLDGDGFGPAPEISSFRRAKDAPDVSGSLTDDVRTAFEAIFPKPPRTFDFDEIRGLG